MYRIIGGDGREYGPVELPVLEQWIREGRVNSETRVRREGNGDWQPAAAFPELASALGLGGSAAAAGPTSQAAAPTGPLRVAECVAGAWRVYQRNFGTLFLGTLVFVLLTMVISLVPFLGGIAQLILTGPLVGGCYWLFLCRMRERPAGVGEVFAGFRRGFVQLMLCHIVVTLLVFLSALPGVLAFAPWIIERLRGAPPSTISLALCVVGVVYAVCAVVYLTVCWMFALPLIVDKQCDFWPAMQRSRRTVHSQFWRVLGLAIVAGLVSAVGALLCGIGIALTLPLGIGTLMYAYEKLFADVAAAAT